MNDDEPSRRVEQTHVEFLNNNNNKWNNKQHILLRNSYYKCVMFVWFTRRVRARYAHAPARVCQKLNGWKFRRLSIRLLYL